jgi:hypothetical protein
VFSLDSPLISSVSSGSIYFTKGRQISPTNPITLPNGTSIQATIFFPQGYQVMQLTLTTSEPINSFIARIGTINTVLNASLVSTDNGSYEYVIVVPPALTQPVTKVAVVITILQTTNITGFTIEACTGNNLIVMKGKGIQGLRNRNFLSVL